MNELNKIPISQIVALQAKSRALLRQVAKSLSDWKVVAASTWTDENKGISVAIVESGYRVYRVNSVSLGKIFLFPKLPDEVDNEALSSLMLELEIQVIDTIIGILKQLPNQQNYGLNYGFLESRRDVLLDALNLSQLNIRQSISERWGLDEEL